MTRQFLEDALPQLDDTNENEYALKVSIFSAIENAITSDLAEKQEDFVPYPLLDFYSLFYRVVLNILILLYLTGC